MSVAAVILAAVTTVSVPATVTAQLSRLEPVDRFASLPAAIRTGEFTVDGVSAAGWRMAEPGSAFSATDVPVPNAPGRRLVFAACDATLCLIHYERGGIAHFYQILALSLQYGRWRAIWNAVGPKPVAGLADLRASLAHQTVGLGWYQQRVKGDF